jgi:hypothetical protein
MPIARVVPGEQVVYDIDQLRAETSTPVREVHRAIGEVVEPIITNPRKFGEFCIGLQELLNNIEIHGSPDYPRLVIVRDELWRVAVDLLDRRVGGPMNDAEKEEIVARRERLRTAPLEDQEETGRGGVMINDFLRDYYTEDIKGDLHMGHLSVPHNGTTRRLLE